MKACLRKLGLIVNDRDNAVPPLSRLHLSSSRSGEITRILAGLKEIISVEGGEDLIKDENDTFHLVKPSTPHASEPKGISPVSEGQSTVGDSSTDAQDRILDYNALVKHIVPHYSEAPTTEDTPNFNIPLYFGYLEFYQSKTPDADTSFGQTLLYGEVVTSTNTLLEK